MERARENKSALFFVGDIRKGRNFVVEACFKGRETKFVEAAVSRDAYQIRARYKTLGTAVDRSPRWSSGGYPRMLLRSNFFLLLFISHVGRTFEFFFKTYEVY